MKSGFTHLDGYKLGNGGMATHVGSIKKAMYEFFADKVNPVTFRRENGELIRCDKHFLTDLGSIPRFLTLIVPRDQYREPFIFHDSSYIHWGEYVKGLDDLVFLFRPMTMTESNQRLREMMLSQGAWKVTAYSVYAVLQVAGKIAWNKGGKKRDKQ